MQHSFNIDIANDVGVNAAIIFNNFCFWILHNEKNNLNYHDGKHWVYNSNKALSELFPYLTERQVSNAILKLREKEYLITGKYNDNKYNHTLWYAFGDKGEAFTRNTSTIYQNWGKDNTKIVSGITNNVECINKDINKDKITNIKEDNNTSLFPEDIVESTVSVFEELKSRINALYKRRSNTPWSKKDINTLKEIAKREDVLNEMSEIERLYNSGYEYRRTALSTFVNNFDTELDRARMRFSNANTSNMNNKQYINHRATNVGEEDYGKDVTNGF